MIFPFSDDTTSETGTALNGLGNEADLFPASFAQEQQWRTFDQRGPDNLIHHLSLALHLQGRVDMAALQHSLDALALRHETLRTHFVMVNGCLQQCVVPRLTLPLPLLDFRTLENDQRSAQLQQTAQDEARRPFDLAQGPLLRTTLLWLEREEYVLLLTLHRSIADAWSVNLWSQELRTLYASFVAGKPSSLPELSVQYADYAAWQREWLQGELLEQELDYWKQRLSGAPAILELPTDHPRPAIPTYQHTQSHFHLSSTLTAELDALARQEGVTLFMLLLATCQLWLSRLTGQHDIVVGTSTAGRSQLELAGLIGCFANTLALRCEMTTDATFHELLEQVRETALEAYEHQELPFELLMHALHPNHNLSYQPIIQAFFAFQELPQAGSPVPSTGLQFTAMDLDTNATPYDLMLSFSEGPGEERELVGSITYRSDLFESATILHWTKQLHMLLECIVADPQQPLSVLLTLNETELQRLLERWSTLTTIWSQVLRIASPDIHTNFFEAGGDSILSLLVVTRAREAGLVLTPQQIFQHQTIAELAKVAKVAVTAASTLAQEAEEGLVPLTPIQHWFFEQKLLDPHHWNQTVLLEIVDPLITPQVLQQALKHLTQQHHALTLRFKRGTQGWEQYRIGEESDTLEAVRFVDLSRVLANEQANSFAEEAARAQASLHLTDGPLLRLVYFAMGDRPSRLLIVIHHLAVDGVSWRILLQDLQTVCQQLLRHEPVQLPQRTASFKHWAERLQTYATSEEIRQQRAYWLADDRRDIPLLPVDFAVDRSVNIEAAASSLTMGLSLTETDALLHHVAKAYHTQIHEILLTALVLACASWTGSRRLLVDIEGHGREGVIEDVDLSQTVGWFTTIFPVLLDLKTTPSNGGLGNAIKTIKELVRALPHNGIGYGLLRYVSGESEMRSELQDMPQAEISFNYLGQFDPLAEDPTDSLFSLTDESCGPPHSLRARRRYVLDVTGIVTQGRLHVEWKYCTQLHRLETVETLARRYIEMLRALIEHCQASLVGEYTPSDFSGSKLNQAKLDKIMAKLRTQKQA